MAEPIYAQRYRLVEALPPGRAVAAHRALDADGQSVIIVVVRPQDPDAFLRRMEVVASVRHLDVAEVVDFGRDGGDCFVVTRELRGNHAAALAARGPLPAAAVTLIGAQAAAGLAALHARGTVHAGIDPDTVIQTGDGTVKLAGAGVETAYPPPDLSPAAPAANARYLSPEEVEGQAAEPASDIYRLGLVLYLLATGKHAFDGANAQVVAEMQIQGVVQPPHLRNPAVPRELERVIMTALAKDPAQRYVLASQMEADLERVLGTVQAPVAVAPVSPEKHRTSPWLWVVIAIVAAIAAVGVAYALGAFSHKSTPTPTSQVAVPDLVGSTLQAATNSLGQAGLKVGPTSTVASSASPTGTVVSQSPLAGTNVAKGSAVGLQISSGGTSPSPTATANATVPDVVGSTRAAAQQLLIGAGFVVIVQNTSSPLDPAGTVVSQAPSGGVVAARGSQVTIQVSTGPSPTPTSSGSP